MKQILNSDSDIIVFENDIFTRTVFFRYGKPVRNILTRKASGYSWVSEEKALPVLPGFDWEHVKTVYDSENSDILFQSNYIIKWHWTVPEKGSYMTTRISVKGMPFHYGISPKSETLVEFSERIGHTGKHTRLKRIVLRDMTDGCDSLVREDTAFLYNRKEGFYGNIFFITDPQAKESVIIQKDAPCGNAHLSHRNADLYADCGDFAVSGTGIDYEAICPDKYTDGYPVTVSLCEEGDEERTCRKAYTECCGNFKPFLMSNTWGDRSRDANVNEVFLKDEILRAEKIGVDILQIDDGWQNGKEDDYWEPDPERFPSGFDRLCDFASAHHIATGLWFVPDEKPGYEEWEPDADTLLGLYRRFGIRHFKIDGVDIPDKISEANLISMLDKVTKESSGAVTFNMDITADRRFGYLYKKEYGTLFVENRYTDWSNYYPHNTLRNLWQLSHYIPAGKMQFEVLNPARNADKYSPDDILSPVHYRTDYLFATVMASEPLLWMEMQNLPEDELTRLSEIVRVWKKYRGDFRDVIPRGSCPDGFSMTGFEITGEKQNYYIGIRENTEKNTVSLPVSEILYTDDKGLSCGNDTVTFSEPRRFFFAILSGRR